MAPATQSDTQINSVPQGKVKNKSRKRKSRKQEDAQNSPKSPTDGATKEPQTNGVVAFEEKAVTPKNESGTPKALVAPSQDSTNVDAGHKSTLDPPTKPSRRQKKQKQKLDEASKPQFTATPGVQRTNTTAMPSSNLPSSNLPSSNSVWRSNPKLPDLKGWPDLADSHTTKLPHRPTEPRQRESLPVEGREQTSRFKENQPRSLEIRPKQNLPPSVLALDNEWQPHSGDAKPHNGGYGARPRQPFPPKRKINDPNKHSDLPPPHKDVRVSIIQQEEFLQPLGSYYTMMNEMISTELVARENLRLFFLEVCREVVASIALETDPNFDPESVQLKCYGSTRAGFALRGSDVDLALVSPMTEANPSFDHTRLPRLLELVLLTKGVGARLLTRTRVPILKTCQYPTPNLMDELCAERLRWQDEPCPPDKQAFLAGKENKSPTQGPSLDKLQTQGPSPDELPIESHHSPSESSTEPSAGPSAGPSAQSGNAEETGPSEESLPKIPSGLQGRSDEELLRRFSIAIHEGWYSEPEREIISTFAQCHEEAARNPDDPALGKARIALRQLPDILSRYREPRTNSLDFPKNGVGIQCDINFSNPLALHNTTLLRCYGLCDPRIRNMVLFVKTWAKRRDINTPYNGTLSSYGYVLMVLHYAINIASPPLAPNLQHELGPDRGGLPGVPTTCDGYNVHFWRNENQIKYLSARGQINDNKESLGSLLRGFFQYFAENGHPHHVPRGGFSWTQKVLSLRTRGGLLSKESKGWTGARTETVGGVDGEKPVEVKQRYLFAIEDPFETEHNVARPVIHMGICAIRDEFRRANRIIKCGGIIDGQPYDLMAETKHQELDRTRFFGPRPNTVQSRFIPVSRGVRLEYPKPT